MKHRGLYFLISGILICGGIFSMVRWGFRLSIDFTGGSNLEIKSEKIHNEGVDETKIRQAVAKTEGIKLESVQNSGDAAYLLKLGTLNTDQKSQIISNLKADYDDIEEVNFETVGPILGREMIRKTIMAVILAAGFILIYVGRQFKDRRYGLSAILAMLHDSLILLGTFSLLGHFYQVEIDTLFVTAMLTVLSFSVHDTIVVYDRLREGLRVFPKADFEQLANKAVAEILGRSLNNSLTIIFMLVSLYLLGGETIRWFVLALLVGTISGTYSSTFTAVPLLVVMEKWQQKRKK
jgi:preprotein translocase subunit SecF